MRLEKRNYFGYSLIETMTVICVIAIVLGLLFAYQDKGWKLFYQSYSRGLSQVKAKIAIRILSDDLREANKTRLTIDKGVSYGVPTPDDMQENSPYIYFTKPQIYEKTGDVIAYNYVLYYFAKPKEKQEIGSTFINKNRKEEKFLILKSIKFINQSKHYTEDEEKKWPFLPPIIEIHKVTLPEDESFKQYLTDTNETNSESESQEKKQKLEQEQFIDHFAYLKEYTRNIPLSGNFLPNSLTDPFTKEEVSILFGNEYKTDKPIKIKVSIHESPILFGLSSPDTSFEVEVTPRN